MNGEKVRLAVAGAVGAGIGAMAAMKIWASNARVEPKTTKPKGDSAASMPPLITFDEVLSLGAGVSSVGGKG